MKFILRLSQRKRKDGSRLFYGSTNHINAMHLRKNEPAAPDVVLKYAVQNFLASNTPRLYNFFQKTSHRMRHRVFCSFEPIADILGSKKCFLYKEHILSQSSNF